MAKHIVELGRFDVAQVVADLEGERASLFDLVTLRQTFPGSPHHATKCIFLRAPQSPRVEDYFEDVPHGVTRFLTDWPAMTDLVLAVSDKLPGPIGKVLVVSLQPRAGIDWHIDEGNYAEAYNRVHLALVTNPGAILYSGGEAHYLEAGAACDYDVHVLHSAANYGDTPRVHLLIDYRRAQ